MKVIKDNRGFVLPLALICGGCKSELEVEAADLKPLDHPRSFLTGKYGVDCPLCHCANLVQSADPYYQAN